MATDRLIDLTTARALAEQYTRSVEYPLNREAVEVLLAVLDLREGALHRLAAAQARSAEIEAAARDVVAEWSKPASTVDMAEVGSRLDDLVRVLEEGT